MPVARTRSHASTSSPPSAQLRVRGGDPVFRDVSDRIENSRRTGYPPSRGMTAVCGARYMSHVIASAAKQSMTRRGKDGLLRYARKDGGWNCALLHHADLAEIFCDAGMNQIGLRRRRDRVRRGRLAGLCQFLAEGSFRAMQRLREPIGDVIRQAVAHQDKTPGADRVDRGVLVWVAAGRHRQRLEEAVFGPDPR